MTKSDYSDFTGKQHNLENGLQRM